MVRMKRHTGARGRMDGRRCVCARCTLPQRYTTSGNPDEDSSAELTVEARPGSLMPHSNFESSCVSSTKQLLCISHWIQTLLKWPLSCLCWSSMCSPAPAMVDGSAFEVPNTSWRPLPNKQTWIQQLFSRLGGLSSPIVLMKSTADPKRREEKFEKALAAAGSAGDGR